MEIEVELQYVLDAEEQLVARWVRPPSREYTVEIVDT